MCGFLWVYSVQKTQPSCWSSVQEKQHAEATTTQASPALNMLLYGNADLHLWFSFVLTNMKLLGIAGLCNHDKGAADVGLAENEKMNC